jgi:(p)ppGpp synthase/HD superfamily hydrolase
MRGERGINYLAHLGDVTMEIFSAHLEDPLDDLDLAVQCAILHDTIEDQNVSHGDLRERFGSAVADGVLALSKAKGLPKSEVMRESLARIRQQPKPVWCVKLADRISNLHDAPSDWTVEKITFYRAEAATILDTLGAAHRVLASRLEALITTYPGS